MSRVQVVGDGFFGRSFGRRAHDHAVLRRLHLLQDRLELAPFLLTEPTADAGQVLIGREDQEAPRQRDLRREAGALAAHRVLGDLDQDGLTGLQHLLDPRCVAFEVLGRIVDLAGVQHTVATSADVDERCLHARQHVLDAAQVDVADHGRGTGPRDVVLDQHVLLEHRDLVPVAALGDDHELVGEPGRHDQRLTPAAPVAATAASRARTAGTDPAGGTAGRHLLLERSWPSSAWPSLPRCPRRWVVLLGRRVVRAGPSRLLALAVPAPPPPPREPRRRRRDGDDRSRLR